VRSPGRRCSALQALVSRLRRALPDAVIESHPASYRLLLDPDAVDVAQFERLIADGQRFATTPSSLPVRCATRSFCGAVPCCPTWPA
jgi:hypothetical protein